MKPITMFRIICTLGLLVLVIMPLSIVYADVGPKPSMEFTFEFKEDPIGIVSGQLMQCSDETCSDAKPLEKLGPQGFQCGVTACDSMAYGYADYNMLIIEFTDKVRTSNIFTKEHFFAKYTVTVLDDSLEVKEVGGRNIGIGSRLCGALPFTVAVETLVAAIYLAIFHLPRAGTVWVAVVSLFTLPFVWIIFPMIPLATAWTSGLSEVFATGAEAGILFLVLGRSIPAKHIIILSILMNGLSFSLGYFLG